MLWLVTCDYIMYTPTPQKIKILGLQVCIWKQYNSFFLPGTRQGRQSSSVTSLEYSYMRSYSVCCCWKILRWTRVLRQTKNSLQNQRCNKYFIFSKITCWPILNIFPEFLEVGLWTLADCGNETGGFCCQGYGQQNNCSRLVAAAGLFESQNRAHWIVT